MKSRSVRVLHLGLATGLVAIMALLVGCGSLGGDQNTFNPAGDVASKQRDLFLLVMWPALVIMVLVFGALLYIMIRYRRKEGDELPQQIHGNTRLELAWTIAPALLLLGLAVPTVAGVIDLGRAPHKDALHVQVEAYRFGWTFHYLDPEYVGADGQPLTVSDQLHIPIDREIGIELKSDDVIHSFWVPRLAGKLDVMPGRHNQMWFNAKEVGTYSGQCAELCGIGHAGMRFSVVADTKADFDAWIQQQLSASASGQTGQ